MPSRNRRKYVKVNQSMQSFLQPLPTDKLIWLALRYKSRYPAAVPDPIALPLHCPHCGGNATVQYSDYPDDGPRLPTVYRCPPDKPPEA